jgi:3-hydroxyisobutyrate dehydrogenase-like beta-hydroxyacid dehydrogenase
MRVGFIGLGHQGASIARRSARSSVELIACDLSADARAAFDEALGSMLPAQESMIERLARAQQGVSS